MFVLLFCFSFCNPVPFCITVARALIRLLSVSIAYRFPFVTDCLSRCLNRSPLCDSSPALCSQHPSLCLYLSFLPVSPLLDNTVSTSVSLAIWILCLNNDLLLQSQFASCSLSVFVIFIRLSPVSLPFSVSSSSWIYNLCLPPNCAFGLHSGAFRTLMLDLITTCSLDLSLACIVPVCPWLLLPLW